MAKANGKATANGLRFVDADGHVLEHPTRYVELAPKKYKDRIWHIETRADGSEWLRFDGQERPAQFMASAGVAGMTPEKRKAAFEGKLKYTETRPAGFNPKPRLADMTTDHIDQSVLYPTMMLGLVSIKDPDFALAQCQVYNDWLQEYCSADRKRLFGVAAIPQQDLTRAIKEIYRAKETGHVGVFLRPNPLKEGQFFDDPFYDPLWRACEETGLAVGLHPFLNPDMPGACRALHLQHRDTTMKLQGNQKGTKQWRNQVHLGNVLFTQAIANPFDMMLSMTYLLAGGVCERFPKLKLLFLEANGGWIVPWLERIDHHAEMFNWDVKSLKMKPSEYFKRQCWISFDADESTLPFTANSPLVGAERIIWASDYPHPDAKYPGVTEELAQNCDSLTPKQKARIFGENAAELYGLPKYKK